jgi:hypothetical protein
MTSLPSRPYDVIAQPDYHHLPVRSEIMPFCTKDGHRQCVARWTLHDR